MCSLKKMHSHYYQRLSPSPNYKTTGGGDAHHDNRYYRTSEKHVENIEESKISSTKKIFSKNSSTFHQQHPPPAAAKHVLSSSSSVTPSVKAILPSSSSSSSSSNPQSNRSHQISATKPSDGNSVDFAGLRFALCGYSEALKLDLLIAYSRVYTWSLIIIPPLFVRNRGKLSSIIKSRKGAIVEEITLSEQLYADEYECESPHKSRCILLSHPCDFRKPKYMMALASGRY